MFAALQKGDNFYILKKTSEGPVLEIGQIDSVSAVKGQFGSFVPLGGQGVVTLTVTTSGQRYEIPDVPSNVDYFNHEKENMILSENREKVKGAISAMMEYSKNRLSEVPYHNATLERCPKMLAELDPVIAKDAARDADMAAMKEQINKLEQGFTNIQGGMSEMLSLLKSKSVNA